MSKNTLNPFHVTLIIFLAITSVSMSSAASASECEEATFLNVEEERIFFSEGKLTWFEIFPPERGVLHVEIHSTGPASDARLLPILGFWGSACDERAEAAILHRSPEHLTLKVDASTKLLFRVADQRGRALGSDLAIRTAFQPTGPALKGGEDEEIIELDGLRAAPSHPGTSHGDLCPRRDDHGDSLACASRVGSLRKLAGSLEDSADIDIFHINIGEDPGELWRLRLEGSTGLQFQLLDADGLPLSSDVERGVALASGEYFLKVQGEGSIFGAIPMPYRLAILSESW